MGCAASTIEKDERLRICKERKKLMKRLVLFRGEFADALLAYLKSLKDTGATLRQFTESESLESLELESSPYRMAMPPSPPPPLPPSPPPPPPLSPDLRKFDESNQKEEVPRKESTEIEEDDNYTSSPPPIHSSWYSWDPFRPSSPHLHDKKSEIMELVEDEKWAETKSEFEEDQKDESLVKFAVNPLPEKPQLVELFDDDSSTMSGYTKDTTDMPMLVLRGKKTLEGIMREVDDYFLKASAGGKEIAVLVEINGEHPFLSQDFKEKNRKNSAKVFSALSWSWSSKSLQVAKESVDLCGSSEPCRPGAHCVTLKKLDAAEQRLYKEMKKEEMTKLDHERKSFLLQKQEDEHQDWTKTDKTREIVETLETELACLQQSISRICSSILELTDEELYPQLVVLTSGLMQMWKTMRKCHQVQNHIAQQLNHLHDNPSTDFSTDYHRRATAQLEAEVTYWYNNFCKLVNSQREYVRTLSRWIQLTDGLADDHHHSHYLSVVRSLCKAWQLSLERLPDKVASDAIKNFLSAIHSILLQQEEEYNLQKKFDKLDQRLQKELSSLAMMEMKLEESLGAANSLDDLSPKHPVSVKRSKTEALKRQVDSEKAKYLTAVQVTRTITLNTLKIKLPIVFQSLMEFSSASAKAIEAVHGHVKPGDTSDAGASENPTS